MRKIMVTCPPCKDYERQWKNHCVDKGLKDNWLEALNALQHYDLVSICEGHEPRRSVPENQPYIYLSLKGTYSINRPNQIFLPKENIQPYVNQLSNTLIKLFPVEKFQTGLNIGFRIINQTGNTELDNCLIKIIAVEDLIHSTGSKKIEWFELATKTIIDFDNLWGESLKIPLIYKNVINFLNCSKE